MLGVLAVVCVWICRVLVVDGVVIPGLTSDYLVDSPLFAIGLVLLAAAAILVERGLVAGGGALVRVPRGLRIALWIDAGAFAVSALLPPADDVVRAGLATVAYAATLVVMTWIAVLARGAVLRWVSIAALVVVAATYATGAALALAHVPPLASGQLAVTSTTVASVWFAYVGFAASRRRT